MICFDKCAKNPRAAAVCNFCGKCQHQCKGHPERMLDRRQQPTESLEDLVRREKIVDRYVPRPKIR